MRKNIIQSKTEPNKNDIWLSEEGLKKYGKKGWESLGGGISPNTPIVNEVSGNELVPINQNGENKAVSAAALVKGAKEVYIVDLDNYNETIYNEIKAAYAANKIIIINDKIATFTDSDSAYISDLENKKTIYYSFSKTSYSTPKYPIGTFKDFSINLTADSLIPSDDGTYIFKSNSTVDESYNNADIYDVYVNSYRYSQDVIPTNCRITFYKKWKYEYQSNYGPVYIGMVYLKSSTMTSTNFDIWAGRIYRGADGYMYLYIKKISEFITSGEGTKFLSDDGTYKEVSGGNEPYVIDDNSNPSEVFNYLKTNHDIHFTKNIIVSLYINQTFYDGKVFYINEYENYVILEALGHASNYGGYYNGQIFTIKISEEEISLFTDKEGNTIYSNVLSNIAIASTYTNNIFNSIYGADELFTGYYYINEIKKETTFTLNAFNNYIIDFTGFLNGTYGYQGEFSFGDTVYTVTFPEEVKWSTDSVLEYKPNHTYQFRILNNLGVMKEFANA